MASWEVRLQKSDCRSETQAVYTVVNILGFYFCNLASAICNSKGIHFTG